MASAGSSVVVTGANGYIGRHAVAALHDAGAVVTAAVRPGADTDFPDGVRVLETDLLDPALDVASWELEPGATVLHLAWSDGFTHNAPSHLANLSTHFRLLDSLVEHGAGRVTGLGSMHEIGYWEGAIDEHTPTNPLSLYGVAKNALRKGLEISLKGRAEYQWLRCFYIVGDDRRNHSVFTKILQSVDEGRTTFPFTSGKHLYDFIDVHELGRQIAAAPLAPDEFGIINCCTGEPVSLATRVESFIEANQLPIALEYGAFPDRPYDSPGTWGDATRIRRIMGVDAR